MIFSKKKCAGIVPISALITINCQLIVTINCDNCQLIEGFWQGTINYYYNCKI